MGSERLTIFIVLIILLIPFAVGLYELAKITVLNLIDWCIKTLISHCASDPRYDKNGNLIDSRK